MTVEIVAPVEFQGNVIGAINQRKGTIIDTEVRDDEFTLTAEVALNDMFGYSSQLRGMTQGKGMFILFTQLSSGVSTDNQVNSQWSTRCTHQSCQMSRGRWSTHSGRSNWATNRADSARLATLFGFLGSRQEERGCTSDELTPKSVHYLSIAFIFLAYTIQVEFPSPIFRMSQPPSSIYLYRQFRPITNY